MPQLEADDIQTLVFSGFPRCEGAVFLRLDVHSAPDVRIWLKQFAEIHLTTGSRRTDGPACQIAFTAGGLKALGLEKEVLAGFSLPFRAGMDAKSREKILGDVGMNAPEDWDWGSSRDGTIPHALLLAYADDVIAAGGHAAELLDLDGGHGWNVGDPLEETVRLPGSTPIRAKEHFGFDDGIGNPEIRGVDESGRSYNEIAAGEIVLGYPDETGAIPPSPRVSPGGTGGAVLPNGDLGRNGSYLVVRQLAQGPRDFWRFVTQRAADARLSPTELAAKMVGRWPNGAPLTLFSKHEPTAGEGRVQDDDFLYSADRRGLGCPLGSHVRRCNPRDAFPLLDEPGPSIKATNRRRLLRRGRTYGPSLAGFPDGAKMAAASEDGAARGLHFLCLCADLDRQFEFVQQSWINSRKLSGLPSDPDPLLVNPAFPQHAPKPGFTIPRQPLNARVEGLSQFVRVKGGAYFFLPGKRALIYLAGLTGNPEA